MIADYSGDISGLLNVQAEGVCPILATRNLVAFPGVITPVLIGRESSLELIKKVKSQPDTFIAIFSQKDETVDEPTGKDLYRDGIYAKLVRVLQMPGRGENVTAIFQGLGRCKLEKITQTVPYLEGLTSLNAEELPDAKDKEYKAAVKDLREKTLLYIRQNDELPDDNQFALQNIENDVLAVNFTCSNIPFSVASNAKMLQANSTIDRVLRTLRPIN